MGNAAISLVTQGFLSGCTPLAGFANLNLWSVIPPEAAGSFSTHTPGRRDPQTTRVSPPWWAVQDLNLRPHACEACALTTELTARTPIILRDLGPGTRDQARPIWTPKQARHR